MSPSQKQHTVFKGIYEFEDPSGTSIVGRVPHTGSADLYSGTAIVVRPNQWGVLVYKGKITDILSEGLHEVKTENFPIITRLTKWKFGFRSPLKCAIWFFSKAVFTARRWGTPKPVLYDFPEYRAVPIRAFGLFNIVAKDPTKIYKNLIGNKIYYDITDLETFVQGQIAELLPEALDVVPSLAKLNSSQDKVSNKLQLSVNKVLNKYGVELVDLQVMSLVPSQEIIKALDAKTAMNIVGNKQEYLLYKAANSLTEDGEPGKVNKANDPMQLMLGLMLGKGLMGADFRAKERVAAPKMTQAPKQISEASQFCPKCGARIKSGDKFCSSCGRKLVK